MVPETQSQKALTSYVVMSALAAKGPAGSINDGVPENSWRVVATVDAKNQGEAIKQAVGDSKQAGTFVAVPASSWKPTRVVPKTVTTLTLEEVGS